MSSSTVAETIGFTQFRNLEPFELQLGAGVHVLTGPNGAGKTSVLDVLHYLCLGRSNFGYGDAASITHDKRWSRLTGTFATGERREHIVVKLQARKPKAIERNGATYGALTEHVGLLPVVMISPDDMALVVDGPDERRRYINQTISQYDRAYLQALVAYNRLLKQRSALLKATAHPLELDLKLIETYDEQLEPLVKSIAEARRGFVERLEPMYRAMYGQISAEAEQASLELRDSLQGRPFRETMRRFRDQDVFLSRTHVGPHRDELELLLDGQTLRRYASQGQRKSVALALRLAQAELLRTTRQRAPLLLLDDLFDRLDPDRVRQLLQLVTQLPVDQIVITDTDAHRMREATAQIEERVVFHHVEKGLVSSSAEKEQDAARE